MPNLFMAVIAFVMAILVGGCAELIGATRSSMVGEEPCPPGTQKSGGPPPGANIEACVQACGVAAPQGSSASQADAWGRFNLQQACLNGPYRAWASDATLRATGEMRAAMGPTGKWTFYAPDGSKALSCDLAKAPVACTEWKAGAADEASRLDLKYYVGGLADLMDRTERMAVDLFDASSKLRERRVYSPAGAVMVQCPPSHIASYHQYTQNRTSADDQDFEAYCIQTPPNACLNRDPCVKYMGLHCEAKGEQTECVDDGPLMDGVYRYWSKGRHLSEEGAHRVGTKIGDWTKYAGDRREITTYSNEGRRTGGRLLAADNRPVWEATFDGDKFVSSVRTLPNGVRLNTRTATASEFPYACEMSDDAGKVTASGPCSTTDPLNGDIVKQGMWTELIQGKRRTAKYIDGVTEAERKEAEKKARAEAAARERERQEALARGECLFDGSDGVECELRLCAKIAGSVRAMEPDSSCVGGEPLDGYRSDWGQALRAIDDYLTVLRTRGDIGTFRRIQQRVLLCRTPDWFRSCSN